MKKLIVFIILAVVLIAGGSLWYLRAATPRAPFRTAKVDRGYLKATISATGTLQPEEVVDIGAQVAGRIESLGADPKDPAKLINWGSKVEQGTVLAQIDKTLYTAQVDSASADLKRAEADLLQKKAQLAQATADWKRSQELFKNKGTSQAEYDAAKAVFEIANANIEVSKAQIEVATGGLNVAKTNLTYTTIVAPVNGVIIDRRVNIGQTVVASLSAPSLFLLAKDLSKMEIWATVNEADVGKIRIGQPVLFTLDAYPGKIYRGNVIRQGDYPARLNASMTQNVVTYTVVVSADNKDGTLWPYLTTNLSFIVSEKKDVLRVPNAALRWQPNTAQLHPDAREAYAKMKAKKTAADADGQERGIVWVADGDKVKPIQLHIGASDSVDTEVVDVVGAGDLPVGTELVIGEARAQDRDAGEANPFTPQFGKKKQQEKSQ